MNGTPIIVPKGIRYINDWEGYEENYMFPFPHILDKQIPGCGYTEFCIKNKMNVILCSPRRILLQNKTDQHPGEVYYAKNNLDEALTVDKDTNDSPGKEKIIIEEECKYDIKEKREKEYQRISQELNWYWNSCQVNGKPAKILVTYDSFWLIKDILKNAGILQNFYVVVDEFQSIFTDAVFKATTENSFVNTLQDIQAVVYVSATPMMSKYLQMMPEFASLPAFWLDWKTEDPRRIGKPILEIKRVRSISESIKPVIKKYLDGNYPKKLHTDKNTGIVSEIPSTELVIYVNSVKNIISLVRNNKIKSEDVNILCSDTKENRTRIKNKLGPNYTIGRVLTKADLSSGQKQKKFTFCTRTVYLGADFYSTCAKSYILSDSNIDCLSVDISLDLPQILGRQRLDENPWKNEAVFYYTLPNKDTKENAIKFGEKIKEKEKETEDLLRAYDEVKTKDSKSALARVYKTNAKDYNYRNNYVAVDEIYDNKGDIIGYIPKINSLVKISDSRAFDIQQIDYADRFSVFNTVGNTFDLREQVIDINNFLDEYNKLQTLRDKLKFFCEAPLSNNQRQTLIDNQLNGSAIARYYLELGPEKLKECWYNVTVVKQNMLKEGKFTINDLRELVQGYFQIGEKYSSARIKNDLGELYKRCGYTKPPKATDLEEWFEIKATQYRESGKKINGFEIIKKR